MKTLHVLFAFMIALFSVSANAQDKQDIKKENVKVWGNCEMCQGKIEKAAKAAGASTASWDVDSKVLTVSYNSSKASMEKIEKAVAAAGYDTEHSSTTDAAYNKLPGCCKYDRKSGDGKAEEKKD